MRKKDEERIKELIQEAVVEALTAEIQWEKHKDEETGLPLAHPEYKSEKVFLPAFWVQHLKFHEGAYRGMQETVDKSATNNLSFVNKIEAIGNILLGMEESIKTVSEVAHEARKQIEYAPKSRLAKLEMILLDDASSEAEKNKANKEWEKITGSNFNGTGLGK